MKILKLGLPVLLLSCAGCGTGFVISNGIPDSPHPLPPVLVEPEQPEPDESARLAIPSGHLPPPGQCRIWHPGRPPGLQPASGRCSRLERELPAGAWLLYRPRRDRRHVVVSVCHASRPAVIVAIRTYEADSGRFVRKEPL